MTEPRPPKDEPSPSSLLEMMMEKRREEEEESEEEEERMIRERERREMERERREMWEEMMEKSRREEEEESEEEEERMIRERREMERERREMWERREGERMMEREMEEIKKKRMEEREEERMIERVRENMEKMEEIKKKRMDSSQYGVNVIPQTQSEPSYRQEVPPRVSEPASYDLSGLDVLGETSIPYKQEPITHVWEDHGFKISFPENALSLDESECVLQVKAAISGQFVFPAATELVSGVYSIKSSSSYFEKPVTVGIEHFSSDGYMDDLVFAVNSDYKPPYTFREIDGGIFPAGEKFGEINVQHFSIFAILRRKLLLLLVENRYCASLNCELSSQYNWNIYFAVLKDSELFRTHLKKYFSDEGVSVTSLAHQSVKFSGREIKLDLPEQLLKKGVEIQPGWTLLPLAHPGIKRSEVDEFAGGWPPLCKLHLKWMQSEESSDLHYELNLIGAKQPHNYFMMVMDKPNKESNSASQEISHTTQPDHGRICEQLNPHLSAWRAIGQHLGFKPGELDAIRANPSLLDGAPQSYLSAMLASWLQWAPGDARGSTSYATLPALKSAVDKAGFGLTASLLTL